MFQLRRIQPVDQAACFYVESGELVLVGRGPHCQVQIEDPSVSRVHCRLLVRDGKVIIYDAGSRWGTSVNGERVREQELQPGDCIEMGETTLRLEAQWSPIATTLSPARGVSSPPIPDSDQQAERQHADGPAADAVHSPVTSAGRSMPRVSPAEFVGNCFLAYEIQSVVAKARSGVVFRANDSQSGHPVALKLFHPELLHNDTDRKRFVRAFQTMINIHHENLVTLYDAGRHQGICFTASEFVEGDSAAQLIGRIGVVGMLDWQNVFRITVDVTRALEIAAEHHVVHRNITPRNVLIRQSDGVAKLGDLMLSKAYDGTTAEAVTRPGEVIGELPYLSPELTGSGQPVDARSDIYSLGATVYALLTGRPPFEGRNVAETIVKIQTEAPVPPSSYNLSIHPLFQGVVSRMLEKRPDDRYAAVPDLLKDLRRVSEYAGCPASL